ncbi:hypothetical protein VCR31J2_1360400 [Vibrio coralliirubri]|uniref:Uncharacterized protein n=1 Tax=Vibrio coralliirubri TaxID=1516159 RepID=A0AA86WRX3_9VIBR|nr:hypothetical protein VCR31J2_1360400 [Vibrio coralliirubri]
MFATGGNYGLTISRQVHMPSSQNRVERDIRDLFLWRLDSNQMSVILLWSTDNKLDKADNLEHR